MWPVAHRARASDADGGNIYSVYLFIYSVDIKYFYGLSRLNIYIKLTEIWPGCFPVCWCWLLCIGICAATAQILDKSRPGDIYI